MKFRFYRWYQALLTTILGFLGYGHAEGQVVDGTPPITVYGVPTTHYQVKGQVSDQAGTPLSGIRVSLQLPTGSSHQSYYPMDSVRTDGEGKYSMELEERTQNLGILVFEDVDGREHGGAFQTDTLVIQQLQSDQIDPGDSKWNLGTYEFKGHVKLKKKVSKTPSGIRKSMVTNRPRKNGRGKYGKNKK